MNSEQTASMSDIHAFAIKWLNKFRDPKINEIEFLDHYMADDCKALGFEMDCGHAFEEKYEGASYNWVGLDEVIDDVDDVMLLGSAIYSRWRYFNHWADPREDILSFENRSWFIIALSRMAMLTGEQENGPQFLTGKIEKIRICSNSICYGPTPKPQDEVEQHLSIVRDGRIFFSTYLYGDGLGDYQREVAQNFKIDSRKAEYIMNLFEKHFSKNYDIMCATDVGDWAMRIINDSGDVFQFQGPLIGAMLEDDIDLSDIIRETLNMPSLYVFDGNNNENE